MRALRPGLALTDLAAVAAALILLVAIGVPTLERARELSRRTVCAVNLKALGGAGHVYADANKGQWMVPPHSRRTATGTGQQGIEYLCLGNSPSDIACVGFERDRQSRSETMFDPTAGSTAVTTTRAYWMLVRSGDVSVEQFICPSSGTDSPDPTEHIELYYDFADYQNISYGYLVPFGPRDTRPRIGTDNQVVFAADKGPFYLNVSLDFLSAGPGGREIRRDDSPKDWRRFNSANHGGTGSGEGQNVLFADGHSSFLRTPLAGVDDDNLYSLMGELWDIDGLNLIHGYSPHQSPAPNPYPGKWAFGEYPNAYSSTDSLIYP